MLVSHNRPPRNLDWFYAGPLLYGDWGTSRLYVLGLAFFYTAHASVLYLAAMGAIMLAVAWAYTHICRCFPDGGGVYSAARQLSPLLSVIGATLLICDYIVTIALSVLEAWKYFGLRDDLLIPCSVVTILAMGLLNWFGARSAGRFALVIALAALVASALVLLVSIPFVIKGIETISWGHPSVSSGMDRWESLVRIMLALAGIEAVANMTGIMKQPVTRTTRRTIWPVLIEVTVLNVLFGLALAGLPSLAAVDKPHFVEFIREPAQMGLQAPPIPESVLEYRDTAMKTLATDAAQHHFGDQAGFVFGKTAAIVFGLLLMSAANTAIMAMVSVFYALGKDRELPGVLTKLNYSGVPWVGLIIASVAPAVLLVIERDVLALAELYAIGVVGAITISVLSCAINTNLPIARPARTGMWILGVFMFAVFITIAIAKPNAAIFAGIILACVLVTRQVLITFTQRAEAAGIETPAGGWLAELKREPAQLDMSRPKLMLAARGRYQAEYAVDMARKRHAILFAIYVRTLRVMDVQPGAIPRIEEDPDAQMSLGTVAVLAREAGVPFLPIYVVSREIAAEILDYTATFGCDTLIMGKSKRSLFARRLEGDVVAQVAAQLPEGVSLITRSGDSPYAPAEPVAGKPASDDEAGPPPT